MTFKKYFAPIARKNASDLAISPMPFMPSSMLNQPGNIFSAMMRKLVS